MKSIFTSLVALAAVCVVVNAQTPAQVPSAAMLDQYMETGMEVSGVRAPYYDEDGQLLAQLYGGHARILEGGVAQVENLRVDVYQDGEVVLTLYAPLCFTRMEEHEGRKILTVESEGDVLIDMEQMTLAGKGFKFSSKANRFEILNESRVLVKQAARGMTGVGL